MYGIKTKKKTKHEAKKKRRRSRLAPLFVSSGKHNTKEYKRIDNGINRGSIYGIKTKKKTKHEAK
jgi:hypothetical protein